MKSNRVFSALWSDGD